jgi:hypothetical protein
MQSLVLKWGVMEMVVWSICGPSLFWICGALDFGRPNIIQKLARNLDTVPPITALKGQFQLVPNLKKAAGVKEDDKGGDKKQGGGNNKKRRTRKIMSTRKIRRRMRIGRRPLRRMGKHTRKRLRDAPGAGANTTWHQATTRKETDNLAKSASTNKTVGSTKLRSSRPPWQPSSTQSDKLS